MSALARQAARKAEAGGALLRNMKLAFASVGFMPRSVNHFETMSRTALLRIRSFLLNAPSASCWIEGVAAAMPNTLSDAVPLEPTHWRIFLMVSALAMA